MPNSPNQVLESSNQITTDISQGMMLAVREVGFKLASEDETLASLILRR